MADASQREEDMAPAEHNPAKSVSEICLFLPVTPEERFLKALYASVDEAISCSLERLRHEEGMVPSCRLGCSHCCRFPILMSVAEARTLANFVKRTFRPEQIDALRMRTHQWQRLDESLRGRSLPVPPSAGEDDSPCTLPCPMLVESECSVYDVRPLLCRTHYVLSHPRSCCSVNDPRSLEARPIVIESIKEATGFYTAAMKDFIEEGGEDYCRSMTLLPHGLAVEMGWDFSRSVEAAPPAACPPPARSPERSGAPPVQDGTTRPAPRSGHPARSVGR